MLLGALMLTAVGQIVMRVFFSSGFFWAGELINLLVLSIALVASVAAARSNRHLRIDVVSHFVAAKYARVPRVVVDAFAAFICGVLAWQSWRYVHEVIYGDTVLVVVPAWIVYGLLPLSFALMSYRFVLSSCAGLLQVFRPETDSKQIQ